MAFTRPNVPRAVGVLGTTPEQRGLSTQEFKDKFDEMPEALQQYLIDVLLNELDEAIGDIEELDMGDAENLVEAVNQAVWFGEYEEWPDPEE